jgi:hypothetical protein
MEDPRSFELKLLLFVENDLIISSSGALERFIVQ